MKKTKLLICFVLALVMVVGALPVFATEEPAQTTTAADGTANESVADGTATEETKTEETEEKTEETLTTGAQQTPTPELSTDATCSSPDAKNGKHSFEAWELNDEAHWHRCKYCQKYFGGTHEGQDVYKSDSTLHWHYCNTCKKKYTITEHSFGEPNADFQKICSVCNRKEDVPHEHQYAEAWSNNAYHHWHACTATFGLRGTTFCKYDAFHNEGCEGGTFDENGYCATCQAQYENISDLEEHEFDENGICKVCGAEDLIPDERPGNLGPKWIVFIVIGVVGVAAAAAVFLIKKKS